MKAAVITCLNHRNLGMYSVDLAADAFFSKAGIEHTLYCAHNPPNPLRRKIRQILGFDIGQRRVDSYGGLDKRSLHTFDQLRNYDIVCYWGDFTTNPTYLRKSFAICEKFSGDFVSEEKSAERWEALFGAHARHPFKISIGQNFQHKDLIAPGKYQDMLRCNLMSMQLVLPRDGQSAMNVLKLVGQEGPIVQPFIDCAFFADTSVLPDQLQSDAFGFLCGRSMGVKGEAISTRLSAGLEMKRLYLDGWLSTEHDRIATDFARLIGEIRGCRFIVTDIYHLAINALREGKIVFMLAEDVQEQTGTLGDFKKITLFRDLGLADLLVLVPPNASAETVAEAALARIKIVMSEDGEHVVKKIEALPEQARKQIEEFVHIASKRFFDKKHTRSSEICK